MLNRRFALSLISMGLATACACTRTAETSSTPDAEATHALAPPQKAFAREGQAMGTLVTFTAWTKNEDYAERAFQRAFDELSRIDVLMTDWKREGKPPSDVVRINEAAGKGPVTVAPETIEVIQAALEMSRRSEGTFDITFAALHGLWKFDEDLEKKIPDPKEIERRRKLISWRDVIVDPAAHTVALKRAGMKLGLGGIAKGYAVDRCVAILRGAGLTDFMVQAGGDLYVSGSKSGQSWMVGIKDPRGKDYFAVAPVRDHAFSTAGDYERGFLMDGKRYHHIIDPRTGWPATASRSVTIFAKTALEADALDDAVFILGPEKGLALVEATEGVGAVIVDANNKVWISKRLEGVVKVRNQPTPGP
jgi:thiamine biosynthesis lipoprotein